MAKPLTDVLIKSRKPSESRQEIPDGKIGGLFLIVQPSGAKSWAVRYRADGKPKKLTIGPYPAIDLASARKRAQEALAEVARGNDPAAQKKAAKAAARDKAREDLDRVENVVAEFIARHAKPNTRDWRETERLLNKDVVTTWRGRRLSEIERKDVHRLLDAIVDRGAPVGANRTFAQLRKMCRWALSRGVIDRDPCAGITSPSAEKSRDRVLSDAEIRLAWRAFQNAGWPFGALAQLLLLTGARRSEVAGMAWGEIDLSARLWVIPKERSKNGLAHEVPLSDAAMEILESLPRIDGAGFVFTTTGKTPVSGFSRFKEQVDARIVDDLGDDAEAPENWTLHDLRRTAATGMEALGFAPHIVDAVINHVSGAKRGVTRTYQRYKYAKEKRAALDAWGRELSAIIDGRSIANVVDFSSARQ